jgi:hypothetical protein
MALNEVVGVFIAPNHFLTIVGDGRTRQVGGAPDNHCSLSGARHVNTSIRVWSCCTGQSGWWPPRLYT